MKTKLSARVLAVMLALFLVVGNIPPIEVMAADSLSYTYNGVTKTLSYSSSWLDSCYYDSNTKTAVILNIAGL